MTFTVKLNLLPSSFRNALMVPVKKSNFIESSVHYKQDTVNVFLNLHPVDHLL